MRVIATCNSSFIAEEENLHVFKCNIAVAEEVEKTMKEIIAKFGKIERVVINSGINRDKLFITMSEEEFAEVINVNLFGYFRVLKALMRGLMRVGDARVAVIGSVVGFTGNAGQVNYSASKSALLGMCRSLVKEVAQRGIAINLILPGFIETEMTSSIPSAIQEKILSQIPAKRFGKPSDVAELVEFLLTSDGNYINGAVLTVDGALSMGI
jgi:3-oxoacyl-[acyl-carrier protein] reductase